MSRILNIVPHGSGQHKIVDAGGRLVEWPFDTSSDAWKAIAHLDRDQARRPSERAGVAKVALPSAPGSKKSKRTKLREKKREKPLTAKEQRRMKVAAAKAPGWVRGVAAVKFDSAGERKFRDRKLGSFGPASEVRRIDPAEYEAEKPKK